MNIGILIVKDFVTKKTTLYILVQYKIEFDILKSMG
jgi:hypothetical protein